MSGVQTAIRELDLTGVTGASPLPDSRVYLRKFITDRNITLPAVVVGMAPVAETEERGTNVEDDFGYPVGVAVIIAANQNLETFDADEIAWRQQIRNKFHNRRPTAVSNALGASVPLKICKFEPMPVFDFGMFQNENLYVSPMIIRVVTRETRS